MQESNIEHSYVKINISDEDILTEQLIKNNAYHVRLEVNATGQVDKKMLSDNCYIWVDRTIKAKIALGNIEGLDRLVRMDVRELKEFSEEIYSVAKKAFTKDRRFFLTLDCEEKQGHLVLEDYIKQYEDVEKVIMGCFYKAELIGVLIAVQISSTEYETVLGAILPEWQSKGAGVSLYSYEFSQLQKRGIKTLYSRISTDNVASLNLHISLSKGNISFMQPLDVYIKS